MTARSGTGAAALAAAVALGIAIGARRPAPVRAGDDDPIAASEAFRVLIDAEARSRVSLPIILSRKLCIVPHRTRIHFIDRATGESRGGVDTPRGGELLEARPADQLLYVRTDRSLSLIDPQTAKVVWQKAPAKGDFLSGFETNGHALAPGGELFVADGDARVLGIGPDGSPLFSAALDTYDAIVTRAQGDRRRMYNLQTRLARPLMAGSKHLFVPLMGGDLLLLDFTGKCKGVLDAERAGLYDIRTVTLVGDALYVVGRHRTKTAETAVTVFDAVKLRPAAQLDFRPTPESVVNAIERLPDETPRALFFAQPKQGDHFVLDPTAKKLVLAHMPPGPGKPWGYDGGHFILTAPDGELRCVSLPRRQLLWSVPAEKATAERLADEAILHEGTLWSPLVAEDGSKTRLLRIDLERGKRVEEDEAYDGACRFRIGRGPSGPQDYRAQERGVVLLGALAVRGVALDAKRGAKTVFTWAHGREAPPAARMSKDGPRLPGAGHLPIDAVWADDEVFVTFAEPDGPLTLTKLAVPKGGGR